MTNTELTNFKFVDRSNERKDAYEYLNNNTKSVLVVFGKNKAGKNFFIDQLKKENKDFIYFCFDFNELQINPIKYMMEILYNITIIDFYSLLNAIIKK